MGMLKKGISEPPLIAPKEFQLEFLEKLEGLRHLEKLDNDTLIKAYNNHQTKQFFNKKVMPIEEL